MNRVLYTVEAFAEDLHFVVSQDFGTWREAARVLNKLHRKWPDTYKAVYLANGDDVLYVAEGRNFWLNPFLPITWPQP